MSCVRGPRASVPRTWKASRKARRSPPASRWGAGHRLRRPGGPSQDLIQCGCSVNGAFDWLLEQLTDGEALAAPPTQAVDLGRARASIQSLLNWIDDWAETPEESGIDAIEAEAEAVLALIDGKAVGNG